MAKTAKEDAKGHNVTDAVIQAAERDIDTYEDKLETAKSALRNCRKRYKEQGVNLGQVDAVRKAKRRDLDEVIQDEIDHHRYAVVLRLDLSKAYQAQMDFGEPDPETVEKGKEYDALSDGKAFGKRGEGPDMNPHPRETLAFHAWETGRLEGLALKEEGAAPSKRGRPKKGGSGAEMGPTAGSA